MPPRTTPNSLMPEAKPLWEVAVRLIERLTDADDRQQRRELRAELIETLTQIVNLRPRVYLRPNVYRLEALALHEILADQSGDPEQADYGGLRGHDSHSPY
jgi:hypothetical protein